MNQDGQEVTIGIGEDYIMDLGKSQGFDPWARQLLSHYCKT